MLTAPGMGTERAGGDPYIPREGAYGAGASRTGGEQIICGGDSSTSSREVSNGGKDRRGGLRDKVSSHSINKEGTGERSGSDKGGTIPARGRGEGRSGDAEKSSRDLST